MGLNLCSQGNGSSFNSFNGEQIQEDARFIYAAAFAEHTKIVLGGNVRCISFWLTKTAFAFPSAQRNRHFPADLPFPEAFSLENLQF